MPKSRSSKSTGSITWVLQRVTGIVLILLLLAHFWVQHFFIEDFYGKMNIVDLQTKPSLMQTLNEMNPLWGKHANTYIAPVRTELKGTPAYLTNKSIKGKGPQTITIVEAKTGTQIIHGRLNQNQVSTYLDMPAAETELTYKTITPSQLKTTNMINHSDVQGRVSNIWWKAYNLLFLVLAIYHGMTGMWDVLKDYKFSPLVRLTLYGGVVTIGLILLVVGLLIIVPMGL